MKALVVDDKFYAVDDLIATLMQIDAESIYIPAYSYDEALTKAEENPDISIAFLDVDMPRQSGLSLAEKLIEADPEINIIFVSGYPEYALAAHELYASGFLVKPASKESVERALAHLRYPLKEEINKPRIRMECYGDFAVFIDGTPVKFTRKKSIELLAYLVDREGAWVSNGQLISVLWEDGLDSEGRRGYLRHLIADVRNTFLAAGIDDVILKDRDGIAINRNVISCDYYERAAEVGEGAKADREYMAQFSWAEFSRTLL